MAPALRRRPGPFLVPWLSCVSRSHWKSGPADLDHFCSPDPPDPNLGSKPPREVDGLGAPHRGRAMLMFRYRNRLLSRCLSLTGGVRALPYRFALERDRHGDAVLPSSRGVLLCVDRHRSRAIFPSKIRTSCWMTSAAVSGTRGAKQRVMPLIARR